MTKITKQHLGLPLAIAALLAFTFLPVPPDLPREAFLAFGILATASILWICETFPVGITGLLAIALMMVFGLSSVPEALSGFATETVFYLISVIALAVALLNTHYGARLIAFLLKKTRNDPKLVVLAFIVASALLSSVMSDTSTLIMFLGFAKVVLDAMGFQPCKSNFGKCLFIGSIFGSVLGGFMTLAGGTNNVLVFQIAGLQIGFLDFMIVGVPMAIITIPVFWVCLIKAFRPETLSEDGLQEIIARADSFGKPNRQEKKALAFILILPILWIAGNWIDVLNVMVVALIGLVVAFLPGIKLMTWKQYSEAVPWNVVLMLGSMISIGNLLTKTGGIEFIANGFNSAGFTTLPFPVFLFFFLVAFYAVHTVFPVGATWITLSIPILASICIQYGLSPTIAPIAILFTLAGNFLMPTNPLNSIAYAEGYFEFTDLLKVGFIPSLWLLIVTTLWVPFIVGHLGI